MHISHVMLSHVFSPHATSSTCPCLLLSLLPYLIHSTTGGALPAVVTGVVVAFLFLSLLLGRMKRSIEKRFQKRDKRRECTEKSSDLASKGQESAEEIQGGASAITTQHICTEEQHYESSSAVFRQDWFGNVVGGKLEDSHGDVEQGSPSNDANGTGPQSEPCNPKAVYTAVNKNKKSNYE